jgi:hypothetical protein
MHQAAIRLGLAQSVTEAYQVRLKLSGEPRFVLRAEGVETLECVRTRNERKDARALQSGVIIGWSDAPGGDRTCYQVALENEPER